jgi:hypothetical protein
MTRGTTLFSQTATLDAAGQRTALDDPWGHSSFAYDRTGRASRTSTTRPATAP